MPRTIDRLNEVIKIAGAVDNAMDFYLISTNNVEDEI
jgi:hypothetical protein